MNSTQLMTTAQLTAQIPSGFGVPACGHAVIAEAVRGIFVDAVAADQKSARTWRDLAGTTAVVRDAKAIAHTGDMGFLAPYSQGSLAWSPPLS